MSPPRLPTTRTPDQRGDKRTPPDHTAERSAINTGLPPHSADESEQGDSARLELPHERDQNLDGTHATPQPVMQQAARDLQEGQVDTDLRATPGLDAERRRELLNKPR